MEKLTLKLCSLFLQYPDAEWIDPEAIKEALSFVANMGQSAKLEQFAAYLLSNSLITLQENYVQTFDFQEKVSLHMADYSEQSSLDRSQMLLSLQQTYREAGYTIGNKERPDFIPAILEFIAVAPQEKSQCMVENVKEALTEVHVRLVHMDHIYRQVTAAVLETIDKR
jgi:nitrate reductase delta subunit